MMNINHKKSNCGFSEQLVSYLYGETTGAEKTEFETHLTNCSVCADELAAFSNVQFSLNDWKMSDFEKLSTPLIELPFEKPSAAPVKESWLPAFLRDLFTLSSRGWALATASVAVLLGAGLVGLMLLRAPQSVDVAQSNNKSLDKSSTAVAANTPEESKTNVKPQKSPEKTVNAIKEPVVQRPEPAVSDDSSIKNKRVVKISTAPRPIQKADGNKFPKDNNLKPDNKNNRKVTPGVVDEGDEDDTLRLAEIFDEIDTRED